MRGRRIAPVMRLRRTPGTRPGGVGTGIFVVGFAARRHTSLYYTGSGRKSQEEACKFCGMREEKRLHRVGAFADFALIRHWCATFPLEGEGFFGGTWLCAIPLSNGDPACWRPAWGGVRLCGNDWWSRVIFGGRCRYDEVICSEMTRWGTGALDEKQNAVSVSLTELYF